MDMFIVVRLLKIVVARSGVLRQENGYSKTRELLDGGCDTFGFEVEIGRD
jgi:hypothetical protein